MPQDRHAHLIGEVQPHAVALQLIHHAQRLLVVAERRAHHVGQRLFTRVTKRRVPQIVPVGSRLGKVAVELKTPADRARDARDLQRVRHARAVMVALRGEKDLRLVHEPPEGFGVHDAVGVALIAGAHVVLLARIQPPLRLRRLLRQRR